jgi:uncharacterized protein
MNDEALVTVRVTPGAKRDELVAVEDGTYRVRLRAPPVDGRANESLRNLLAKFLGVPAKEVEIVSGRTSRTKRVRVSGLSKEELARRLGAWLLGPV